MRVREMRELSSEELKARIDETRKNLVELRFQLALRKLESPARLRNTRKRLAQLLTIESEKERGETHTPKETAKPKKAPSQKASLEEAKAEDSVKKPKAKAKAKAE